MDVNIKEPLAKSKRSRSKSPKKRASENMSKEQLIWALKKKKECNAKALTVVKELIEPHINFDIFLHKLKDINQCHYQDIVEERAIIKICGYPLCNETLGEMPKKQFHISLLNKKVYDITERKNFCSTKCFKSSNFIKEQMLTSPLWMRNQVDVPQFKLMSQPQSTPIVLPDLEKLSIAQDDKDNDDVSNKNEKYSDTKDRDEFKILNCNLDLNKLSLS